MLLSGNSNIVRVSSKGFPQVKYLCGILHEILKEKCFEEIAGRTQIVFYAHNKEINDSYSAICQGRLSGEETKLYRYCSTPHLIFRDKEENVSDEERKKAKKRFWEAVYQEAKKYTLSDSKVSEKYTLLCQLAANQETAVCYENLLYVVTLKSPILKD